MIKKISSENLKIGMFVSSLNTPWRYHPFIKNSKNIKNERDIERIRQYFIEEVYIDTEKGKDSENAFGQKEEEKRFRKNIKNTIYVESDKDFLDGDEEKHSVSFKETEKAYIESLNILTNTFQNINNSGILNIEKINDAVSSIVNLVSGNLNSALIMTKLKNTDQYTFKHSLNVALLSVALGKNLGFPESELKVLGTGALLHDCGVLLISPRILNKPNKLNENEYEIIKKHPLYGYEILEQVEGISRKSILIALQHHEKYSGIGYPDGLPGYRISNYAMMVSIADIYDAICTEKPYRKALPPYTALQKIYGWKGTQLNPKLVDYFIKTVGIYPVGSVLKFRNGFIGIVKGIKKENLLSPETMIIIDDKGCVLEKPYLINIESGLEDKLEGWYVDEVIDPSNLPIQVNYYLKN